MSRTFCLLPDQIQKLKLEMKNQGAKSIVEMSSSERKAFFTKSLNNEQLGTEVTSSFEKAMSSKQSKALSKWAKSVFTEKEIKAKTYPDVISKINNLQKEGLLKPSLTDQYLDTLIATSLGLELKAEEVQKINELSEKVQQKEELPTNTQFFGYHTDYFKARKEMNDYIQTLTPSLGTELFFGLIGRGNLLASLKSPTTNVVSNLSSFLTEPIVRRITSRTLSGVNSDLVVPFLKEAHKIYQETGYDPVRMLRIQDEQLTLGEGRVTTQGEGALRSVSRFYEDIVFKQLMGAPDIWGAALHFADSVNIITTKIANDEGLQGDALKERARSLFLKATQVRDTKDDIAHVVREGGIANALYATFQQDTWYAKKALEIRKAMDEASGGLKLGTNLEPFIKTPVNVIGAGIEYSGVTLPFVAVRMMESAYRGEEVFTRDMARQVTRAGLGLMIATLLASALDDDDYMPDYVMATDKEKASTKLSNASYNSIRIGDKWVSLDYFGVLGVALAGMMAAKRKIGTVEKGVAFAENAFFQVRRAPILSTFFDLGQWFSENKKYSKSSEDIAGELTGDAAGFFYSRTVPMILSDVAKVLDDKERANDYKSWQDDIYAKIPFKRETLPPKYNDLGQIIPTENAFWTLFAGARVKTVNDDKAYQEINKLSTQGGNFSITAKGFKEMVVAKKILSPYEYNELFGQVQDSIRNAYLNTTETDEYKEADTEGKVKLLSEVRKGVMKSIIDSTPYSGRIYDAIQAEKDN